MNKIFLSNVPSFPQRNLLNKSLKYYENITYSHILKNQKYITRRTDINPRYLINLLDNPDVFTDLTTALMLADAPWDSNKSSKFYWRNICISSTLASLLKNAEKPELLPENFPNIRAINPPDVECSRAETFELIDKSLKSIKRKYRRIVLDYYYNGLTQTSIGKKYRLHQSRINHILKLSRQKLSSQLVKLI